MRKKRLRDEEQRRIEQQRISAIRQREERSFMGLPIGGTWCLMGGLKVVILSHLRYRSASEGKEGRKSSVKIGYIDSNGRIVKDVLTLEDFSSFLYAEMPCNQSPQSRIKSQLQ